MNKPLISIVIATYNSAEILPQVLTSVRKQTYPQHNIEIIVIDGGSTDCTKKIAKLFNCRIIHNSKTVPAWAKYIGYKLARGKYILYLDSDEVIAGSDSIEQKVAVMQKFLTVHAVTGNGYVSPPSFSFLNDYINEFGDPFSFFIYRLSKDCRFFIDSMKAKYKVIKENRDCVVFDFSDSHQLPIFELVAMGSLVDLQYLRANFPQIVKNPGLIPHIFNLLVSKNSHIAITKHDELIHYSSNTLGKYLGKITSRIISNVFTPAKEGFAGRNEYAKGGSRRKKYLFMPYAFSIVFPLMDALYLSFTRRNPWYLSHVLFCLYTASLIVYYTGLKLLGFKPVFKSYGQAKPVTL